MCCLGYNELKLPKLLARQLNKPLDVEIGGTLHSVAHVELRFHLVSKYKFSLRIEKILKPKMDNCIKLT